MRDRYAVARRAAAALLFALLAASPLARAADAAPPWPTLGWQSSAPEEQGMASSALADLVDFGAANAIDSMLVVRHGKIVLEAHYAPFRPGLKHLVVESKARSGSTACFASASSARAPIRCSPSRETG